MSTSDQDVTHAFLVLTVGAETAAAAFAIPSHCSSN